jgi:disulfide oxidoreductase YuzD
MSREFIESQYNKSYIHKAAKQEKQLAYFTLSDMQEDYLTTEYLEMWVQRKYQGSDYFLNYVKSVFKTKNFLTFFKYLRKPLPSSKLINNKIAPQLRRVFNAENAEFKYVVDGADETDFNQLLNIKDFEQELFGRMLFKHNSLLVSDMKDGNPYRYFIDISDVKSINRTYDGKVKAIAFKGEIELVEDVKEVEGYVYIDDLVYAFYDKDYNLVSSLSHGLGHCPVHFISPKIIGDNWIVRESIFTYIREELEEYTFLKTLQKMTEPNGAIPIITQLDVQIEERGDIDSANADNEGNSDNMMSSQRATIAGTNPQSGDSIMQAGTVFKVPVIDKEDVSIDMEAVKNFVNFHYLPIDSLKYLKERIQDIEHSIIYTVVGGVIDGLKEGSKNESQIEESLSVLQNTLIYFADSFNYIRKLSDWDMLILKFGNRVRDISIFYGTDFFLDTESILYANLEKSKNPIERKNILLRINQNRYRGNENKLNRQIILYDLIPYVFDDEFQVAVDSLKIDDTTFQYQTRFNYWISQFEAKYGDLVAFYSLMDVEKPQKLALINSLIIEIINSYKIKET